MLYIHFDPLTLLTLIDLIDWLIKQFDCIDCWCECLIDLLCSHIPTHQVGGRSVVKCLLNFNKPLPNRQLMFFCCLLWYAIYYDILFTHKLVYWKQNICLLKFLSTCKFQLFVSYFNTFGHNSQILLLNFVFLVCYIYKRLLT